MTTEYNLQNNGGIFTAEDLEGYALADELDQAFGPNVTDPAAFMDKHFAEPKQEPTSTSPNNTSIRQRLELAWPIGAGVLAGCLDFSVLRHMGLFF